MLSSKAWGFLVFLSILSLYFTVVRFPLAYPSVTIDIDMDRSLSLDKAKELIDVHQWPPFGGDASFSASFGIASDLVQEFVELEEGRGTWKALLTHQRGGPFSSNQYHPYHWTVRAFKEYSTSETWVLFAPSGDPYGFRVVLPEDYVLPTVSSRDAQSLAESLASSPPWNVNVSQYALVESDRKTQRGSERVDHTFTYERAAHHQGRNALGSPRHPQATFRMTLAVKGNEFAGLHHWVKIPESFERRYSDMRSWNTIVAFSGGLGVLFIVALGMVPALFLLHRHGWVRWKPAIVFGLFVGALQGLDHVNKWTQHWLSYDTAEPFDAHAASILSNGVAIALGSVVWFTLCYAAGESLTRKAFPHHPQIWNFFQSLQAYNDDDDDDDDDDDECVAQSSSSSGGNRFFFAASDAVLSRFLFGLLCVPIMFAYDTALYAAMQRWLGWWIPSSVNDHPDVHASFLPWLTSIATSLQAGTWEECVFRAIPISLGALVGKRWGHPKWAIGVAVVAQALAFGAGHANYPCQPFYARLVELIVPSLGFAWVYVRYGLFASCYTHVLFDVVWFALPLWHTQGAWFSRAMVLVCSFAPLLLGGALRVLQTTGSAPPRLSQASNGLNGSWRPPTTPPHAPSMMRTSSSSSDPGAAAQHPTASTHNLERLSAPAMLSIAVGCVAVCIVAVVLVPPRIDVDFAPTIDVGRLQAVQIALLDGASPPSPPLDASGGLPALGNEQAWHSIAVLSPTSERQAPSHSYVLREYGARVHSSLSRQGLLPSPAWNVRFARFSSDIDVAERAEEVTIMVDGAGRVVRRKHVVPEHRPGAQLDHRDALELARSHAMHHAFHVVPGTIADAHRVELVSADSERLPNRTDWEFTFRIARTPRVDGDGGDGGGGGDDEYADECAERHPNGVQIDPIAASPETRVSISIAGDVVVDFTKHVHVPEAYERGERHRVALIHQVDAVRRLLCLAVMGAGVLCVLSGWSSSGRMHVHTLCVVFVVGAVVRAVDVWNALDAYSMQFSTSKPYAHQMAMVVGSQLFAMVGVCALSACAGHVVHSIIAGSPSPRRHRGVSLWAAVACVVALGAAGEGLLGFGDRALQSLAFPHLRRPDWGPGLTLIHASSSPCIAAVLQGINGAFMRWLMMTMTAHAVDAVVGATGGGKGRARRWVWTIAAHFFAALLFPRRAVASMQDAKAWMASASMVALVGAVQHVALLSGEKRFAALLVVGAILNNECIGWMRMESYAGESFHHALMAIVSILLGLFAFSSLWSINAATRDGDGGGAKKLD